MKTYDLYLDSGPMKKKTYVHVPALLGCIARGDTSDEAIERSPEAIRTFLAFCARTGERVDPETAFRVRVAQHVTDNEWPGNGGGFLPTDARPLTVRGTGGAPATSVVGCSLIDAAGRRPSTLTPWMATTAAARFHADGTAPLIR